MRFLRKFAALSVIAFVAARDNVFPRRLAAARTRNNVIDVELLTRKFFAAILADESVAHHYVQARKSHGSFRETIIRGENNDARYSDHPSDESDHVVIYSGGKFRPAMKIKKSMVSVERASGPREEQAKRPSGRNDIYRHVQTINDENRCRQHEELLLSPPRF